jgi:hypothetical protein
LLNHQLGISQKVLDQHLARLIEPLGVGCVSST